MGGHRLKLACVGGHFGMHEPQLRQFGDASFGMVVPCDYGDHWLQPDPARDGAFVFGTDPYGWPTAREAFDASDRYAEALAQRYR